MKIYTLLALIGLMVLTTACGWGPWARRRGCCPATCAQYVQPACTTTTATCSEYPTTTEYATSECPAYTADSNGGTYQEVQQGVQVDDGAEFADFDADAEEV